jgi:3-hydroxybutyryl-CoA dehydrogenase
MEISTVGVIGAGTMGLGLAQNLADVGYNVVLIDVNEPALVRARQKIKENTRFRKFFKTTAAQPTNGTLDRILFTTDYSQLKAVNFVIENVPEKWELKRSVFELLDATCDSETVFAANTSAISITRIASVTRRPAKVLGTHFMNPVPLKRMVEVIRGYHTSEEAIALTRGLLTQMGKDCIIVNDSPGFVSNRVLMLTINEAIFLVQDQVAPPEDVDLIFKECFGHRMGPLETADLIGLDTILFSLDVLQESFGDTKYRPCPLLRKMVDAGLLGRKSGKGFYNYQAEDA